MNHSIILIGPACTGKSTQAKLLSQATGKIWVCLDHIADKYYREAGYGIEDFKKVKEEEGLLKA